MKNFIKNIMKMNKILEKLAILEYNQRRVKDLKIKEIK